MPIPSKIYYKKVCDDSIGWAHSCAEFSPDGSAFVVQKLTNARGRQGRQWITQRGQLWVTLLLKPNEFLNPVGNQKKLLQRMLNHLSMALSVGVLEPLKKFGVGLKWPNDFVLDNKKVGGMILDISWKNENPNAIIFGCAINVNNDVEGIIKSEKMEAANLKNYTNEPINVDFLRNELLESLDHWYEKWKQGRYNKIFAAWNESQVYLGKQIKVHNKDGSLVCGIATKVFQDGGIVIKNDNQAFKIALSNVDKLSQLS